MDARTELTDECEAALQAMHYDGLLSVHADDAKRAAGYLSEILLAPRSDGRRFLLVHPDEVIPTMRSGDCWVRPAVEKETP